MPNIQPDLINLQDSKPFDLKFVQSKRWSGWQRVLIYKNWFFLLIQVACGFFMQRLDPTVTSYSWLSLVVLPDSPLLFSIKFLIFIRSVKKITKFGENLLNLMRSSPNLAKYHIWHINQVFLLVRNPYSSSWQ